MMGDIGFAGYAGFAGHDAYIVLVVVVNVTVFVGSLVNAFYVWYNNRINTIVITQERINCLNDTINHLNANIETLNETIVYQQQDIDTRKETIRVLRQEITSQNDDIVRLRKDLETSRICSNIITDCNLITARKTIEKLRNSIQDYRQLLRRWLYFKSDACLASLYKHDPHCEDVAMQVRTNILKKMQLIEDRYKTSSIKTDYVAPDHVPHVDLEAV